MTVGANLFSEGLSLRRLQDAERLRLGFLKCVQLIEPFDEQQISNLCKIASNIDPIPKAPERIDLVVKDYDLGGRVTRPIVTPLKMTIPQLYQ